MTERERIMSEIKENGHKSQWDNARRIREELTKAFVDEIKVKESERLARRG